MRAASFIWASVATHGGTISNSSCKSTKRLRSSKRHIPTASHSLCSISCPRMPCLGMMLFRSEEHTSELQSRSDLVCRLLLEKKKKKIKEHIISKKKKIGPTSHK